MKTLHGTLFFLTMLFLFSSVHGQEKLTSEEGRASLIPGKRKSMIACSGREQSYTLEITASTVKQSDIPGFVTIDGQIVQSTLVASRNPQAQGALTTAAEKTILTQYMKDELTYYKKKLKQNYTGLQSEWITIKDRLFLVWYFEMPKDYKLVATQLYFSTLFNNQVLDLNAPIFKTEQFSHARAVLNRLAGTLKTYNKPLDLVALKKQLSR